MTAPLDRLEALCEAAKLWPNEVWGKKGWWREADTALILACDPATVAALIAVARAAEEEVRAYRERQRSGWEWTRIAALERIAEALAALEGGAA